MAHGGAQTELNRVWVDWTPTFTNLTLGNGTFVARYVQIGKTVHVVFDLTLGSTSSVGSLPTISVPVTASSLAYSVTDNIIGLARFGDFGTVNINGYLRFHPDLDSFLSTVYNAASTYLIESNVSATVPFTWTTNDFMHFSGTYEAA